MQTASDFNKALAALARKSALVYHEGHLMFDRIVGMDAHAIKVVADAAWDNYIAGRCLLVQRKIGANHYEYLAIKV
jgi:hypothetical protein